jgi:hypothetical protein
LLSSPRELAKDAVAELDEAWAEEWPLVLEWAEVSQLAWQSLSA